MTQVLKVNASDLKEASLYWSEAHQCPIYVVKQGASYVPSIDEDGDIYFDEAIVTILTPPPTEHQSFFKRIFKS